MRLVIRPLILALVASLSLVPAAYADLVITSRDSSVSVLGSFVNTANILPVSNSQTSTSTNSNFNLTINGSDSSNGDLGDFGWNSSYTYGNDQNIDVTNDSIQISTSLSLSTSHDEQGVAILSADNRVTLTFQNTAAGFFNLDADPINGNGQYRLESFDGAQWNDLYNGLAGPIDLQFLLNVGTYRITASTFLNDVDNFSNSDNFRVKLSPVPEPGTLAALAIAAGTGYFYRRRSKRTA